MVYGYRYSGGHSIIDGPPRKYPTAAKVAVKVGSKKKKNSSKNTVSASASPHPSAVFEKLSNGTKVSHKTLGQGVVEGGWHRMRIHTIR